MKWKYKHILWDWNGTLVNDMDLCVSVTNSLIQKRKMKLINREIYQREFTFPVVDFYEKIGFDFRNESYEDMAEEWILEYKKNFEANSSLNGAVVEVLTNVETMGFRQSVLSACEVELLNHSIRHLNLGRFFHQIHGTGNNHAHGKVDLAHSLISQEHCSPEESLLFGDTVHDFEVAEAVGIDCVFIANGHQHEDRLKKTGAPVICDISQVPEYLRNILI
ncbi:MAG: HAD hydrolase-like protein [Lentisphaeraceae bacterium]|nr:HAD hydrolase-like protein [Lentisphaeraceae bacterium]